MGYILPSFQKERVAGSVFYFKKPSKFTHPSYFYVELMPLSICRVGGGLALTDWQIRSSWSRALRRLRPQGRQ